jgi:hypothetical protein
VGRATELGEIAARLGRYAVVTLVGVGGVGKTALAVEAAWAEVSAGRAELACYVDLVPCRTDDQVIAALVEAVGIRGAPAAAGLDAVVDTVSGARSLLPVRRTERPGPWRSPAGPSRSQPRHRQVPRLAKPPARWRLTSAGYWRTAPLGVGDVRELRARGADMDWDQAVACTVTQATQALNDPGSAEPPK